MLVIEHWKPESRYKTYTEQESRDMYSAIAYPDYGVFQWTATLLNYELEEGQRLIDALNLAGLTTDSALWIYSADSESWHLMFTSEICDREGTLKAYKEILTVFQDVQPELKIDWTSLIAVSPKHELIEGLRQSQLQWHRNLSGRRLTDNMVNRVRIDDGYVYQIK